MQFELSIIDASSKFKSFSEILLTNMNRMNNVLTNIYTSIYICLLQIYISFRIGTLNSLQIISLILNKYIIINVFILLMFVNVWGFSLTSKTFVQRLWKYLCLLVRSIGITLILPEIRRISKM